MTSKNNSKLVEKYNSLNSLLKKVVRRRICLELQITTTTFYNYLDNPEKLKERQKNIIFKVFGISAEDINPKN